MNTKTARIGAKDLVTVGIYSAIYLVITCALAFLSLIPIMYPLMTIICPIVGGIPFMLFLTKTKKFGMITIMGILMGLVMLLTGMGYWSLITGVIAGLLADLVWKAGKYTSAKMSIVTNGVFSLWYNRQLYGGICKPERLTFSTQLKAMARHGPIQFKLTCQIGWRLCC